MVTRAVLRRSIGVALAVAALAGQQLAGLFTQELIAEAAILSIVALSLDLLATCGLISFGHAGLLIGHSVILGKNLVKLR